MIRKIFQDTISKKITAIRIFDALCEPVWKVWTEQEHIINWW